MIKVVFFDLDGTILSHTNFGVPASTKEALQSLQSQGIKCVLATGRHIVELDDLPVNDLNFDAYLFVNCQIAYDENRQFVDGIEISGQSKEEVLRLFDKKEIQVFLAEEDNIYSNMHSSQLDKATNGTIFSNFPVQPYTGNPIYQAIIFVDREHEKEILQQVPSLGSARWSDIAVDLVNDGNNKATGVKRWCDKNGYDLKETMAFGDGENDVEMLKVCGTSIAMGNGCGQAKEIADYTTTHIDEDGIVNGLQAFGLLNQDKIIDETIDFIKDYFKDDYSGHDVSHVLRVYNLADKIARSYKCDQMQVKLAALLHDVDDRKLSKGNHDTYENTINYLKSKHFADKYIDSIIHIISQVSYKGKDSITPDSIEGQIVQDADRLDALGAIGIGRTFAYGGAKGNTMYDPDVKPLEDMDEETYFNHPSTTINHFYEKLLKLKDLMNTGAAKQLAEERTKYMEEFLDEFFEEYKGNR